MDGSRYAILCGSVGSESILVSGPGRQGCCPDVLHQDGAESHRALLLRLYTRDLTALGCLSPAT